VGVVKLEERIAELEAELAAAIDATVRLGQVIEERTREVELARAEFRALRANLDQIVRQRTRALAESEAQLRAKNDELEKQGRSKAEFISIAAHELRTPLTSIVGYLDLFSEGRFGDLPPLLERPLSSVRRNAHRLKRLVDDMLDVSRIEFGRITLRREPVDLGDVVRDVVTELLPLARARNQKVLTNIAKVDPLDGDRDKLHQIAVNLVSNAIRYTPESGEIAVDVDEAPRERYPGGWARLRVRDNGIGISEEDRQRIFDPFLHPKPVKHHTSAGPDSAGLGLYIARGLIELHGGLITVDSEPEVFTEFTVLLPIRQAQARATGG
jgi:signal transduction histidine kinase